MNDVPPSRPSPITFIARSSADVFQSPSAPKPKPSAISRCTARPGSCTRPCRSSNVVVNALKPPSVRKLRMPSSMRAPSRSDARLAPLFFSGARQRVGASYSATSASIARSLDVAHRRRQIADAVAVDREAEGDLRRHLVAFGHGDLAHVVAEARHLGALQVVPRPGHARPRADAVLHLAVAPVADDDLAAQPHPRVHEPGLAVAVRRLVQVHEVHVDAIPRRIAVELRVQVQHRLLQRAQAADPHLRRRERVHPQDHAGAAGVAVGLEQRGADLVRRRQQALEHHRQRHLRRRVERLGHRLRHSARRCAAARGRRGAATRRGTRWKASEAGASSVSITGRTWSCSVRRGDRCRRRRSCADRRAGAPGTRCGRRPRT